MITPQTIGNILYRDCKGISAGNVYVVCSGDNSAEIPSGEVNCERTIIHIKEQTPGTYWRKSFNEVNIFVPRIQNRPDRIRCEEIEMLVMEHLDGVIDQYHGLTYLYSVSSIGTMTDEKLNCEYVNVKILFEVLNIKQTNNE